MAGPDTIVSRLGQINKTGADDAMFLKQFGGEILTEFLRVTAFRERHFIRQIQRGKSASFPLIGTVSSRMHTPGTWIDGAAVGHAEKVISVDGLIVAPVFIADIDEAMNHYDVRGPYAQEIGQELAQRYDNNVARMFVLAARTTVNPLATRPGGETIAVASMNTLSDVLATAIFSSAQKLDEKNVPDEGRYCWMRPLQYYLCAQNTKLINKDWGGAGDLSKGSFRTLANVDIVKSNNVPSTDLSADTNVTAKYRGNYSRTVAIVGSRWAVGTVELLGVTVQTEKEIRTQGTFTVGRMAVGSDTLRPECAIELAIPAS
jgi:hypothetical protein